MPDLFSTGTSNNAPPPIPGGFGNPTGANTGGLTPKANASGFPNFPNLGPIAQSTTSGLNSSPYSGSPTSALAGLSTSMTPSDPTLQGNQLREFQRAYGKGTGDQIFQMMQQGLFNPQVAQAYLAAQQPGIQRGQADLLNAFGRSGNRFSSSAALGLGDYNSQVQLNQGQLLAGLYQNAQTNQLNFLGNTLGTLNKEEDNSGGGWIDDLVGGLEIAGGVAATVFSAGAASPVLAAALAGGGLGLAGAGASTIAKQGKGGSSSGGGTNVSVPWQNVGTQSPTASTNANEVPAFPQSMADEFFTNNLVGSAGTDFGGVSPDTSGDSMFQAFPNF